MNNRNRVVSWAAAINLIGGAAAVMVVALSMLASPSLAASGPVLRAPAFQEKSALQEKAALYEEPTSQERDGGDKGMRPQQDPPEWAQIDELISQQRYQAAADMVVQLRQAAEAAGDDDQWTRALVKEVQLRIGLSGYETAVELLKQEPWPPSERSQAVLNLLYGSALLQYVRAYSWEIRQRDEVLSEGPLDLKAWTLERIVEEINDAYSKVWSAREGWGSESIGELARYIEQNDYPPRIRGTLRDAVTYLWVELMADTSLWSPGQSSRVYQLDIDALVEGALPAGLTLDDPALHPLERIAAVLGDLEAWHADHDRPEAALEARLERLRRLWAGIDSAADRATVRVSLEATLAGFERDLEWWSMGQYELSRMLQSLNEPESLIKARDAAEAGRVAHPRSVGGRRCASLAGGIKAPGFQLEAMAADGVGKRSLLISHRNLGRLYLRAYRYDLIDRIASAKDYNLLPGSRELPTLLEAEQPVARWTEVLPPTPDLRTHRTYSVPPLKGPGAYVIVASAREDFARRANQLVSVNMIVSDMVILTRAEAGVQEVTVRSGADGDPVAGVEVSLYRYEWRKGHQRLATRTTGVDGMVRFDSEADDPRRGAGCFILARQGDQLALSTGTQMAIRSQTASAADAALVYTDRSVYRPGQRLMWKVVAYSGDPVRGQYATAPLRKLDVQLLDANGEQVYAETVKTNGFGSVSGELEIPPGRLLGQWRLRTSMGGESLIRVEEYKRPTFEVSILEPEQQLRLNREAELVGEARYYFGLPVTHGDVEWRVTREPVRPPWRWWWSPAPTTPEVMARGRTSLDADGLFHVRFTPEADERDADTGTSYRFRLAADVVDPGGETREAERIFRLGFVAVEARIEMEAGFLRQGTDSEVTITRRDLDGTPLSGPGRWRLLELRQPPKPLMPADIPEDGSQEGSAPPWDLGRRDLPGRAAGSGNGNGKGDNDDPYATPGDRLRPRWTRTYRPEAVLASWEVAAERASGSVEHDASGRAAVVLSELDPGAYRLVYTTEDAFGAVAEVERSFIVAGRQGAEVALPALLIAERSTVEVGSVLRLLAVSGFEDQQMVLETYRDGIRVERRVIGGGSGAKMLELPIDESDRGGLAFALTMVRDHQLIHLEQRVLVPWDDRRLTIETRTFRDRVRPGSHETFRFVVRGPDEQTVEQGTVELLAYMYDRSLDLFAAHSPVDVPALYPNRARAGGLSVSLDRASATWRWSRDWFEVTPFPGLTSDRLRWLESFGIGGPGRRMYGAGGPLMIKTMAMAAPEESAEAQALDGADAGLQSDQVLPDATVAEAEAQGPEGGQPEQELRSDFAETALWSPHLMVGPGGEAVIELEVPDSITEWSLWIHGITRDLKGGSLNLRTRSVQDLMVRPYLPRFLREGDEASLRVLVNNAGTEPLKGTLGLEIRDLETGEDLLAAFGLDPAEASGVRFAVEPGGGTELGFPITVPARVGTVAFEVQATAGDLSDGERRPVPVLPGRMHLVQSRFAALHDEDRRELRFPDMVEDDPTLVTDQLVVSVDAQLFYSVLNALPYLVTYPYQCTEQTLNRFLSTGIVSSVYADHPAIAEMADRMAARKTRLEPWDADDPNRTMELEETPWLVEARGGDEPADRLINVLDPRIARARRDEALAELERAQTSLGGFPWWPGGPPSPYMTLYILNGLSRALEHGVEVPKEMVTRAWGYMHQHYLDEIVDRMVSDGCCREMITFLNLVLSAYPDSSWTGGVFTDDDRQRMLEYSLSHWKEHSPLSKCQLALTLNRAGRHADAMLVFASVMDSARTTRDEGTFWAPEDRAWLWYNDTIETHAMVLRTLTELEPDDSRRQGLVQWLMLNKKLNHWSSTRATAEVIYALVQSLELDGALGITEKVRVAVGPRTREMVFEPEQYTGASRLVVPGPEVDPETMSTIVVEKQTRGLAFASATWHFSTEKMPAEARGDLFSVSRSFFHRRQQGDGWVLEPLAEGAVLAPGDEVEVQLSIKSRHAAEYVHLRDPRGAGFEPEAVSSGYRWDSGLARYEEVRDSGTSFFFEWLPAGEYTLKYRLRAAMAGRFRVGPAVLQSIYAPEFAAYSSGAVLDVAEARPAG